MIAATMAVVTVSVMLNMLLPFSPRGRAPAQSQPGPGSRSDPKSQKAVEAKREHTVRNRPGCSVLRHSDCYRLAPVSGLADAHSGNQRSSFSDIESPNAYVGGMSTHDRTGAKTPKLSRTQRQSCCFPACASLAATLMRKSSFLQSGQPSRPSLGSLS